MPRAEQRGAGAGRLARVAGLSGARLHETLHFPAEKVRPGRAGTYLRPQGSKEEQGLLPPLVSRNGMGGGGSRLGHQSELTVPVPCQAPAQAHTEPSDGVQGPGQGPAVEPHAGAAQAGAAQEAPGQRGALAGGLHGLHRYPPLRAGGHGQQGRAPQGRVGPARASRFLYGHPLPSEGPAGSWADVEGR